MVPELYRGKQGYGLLRIQVRSTCGSNPFPASACMLMAVFKWDGVTALLITTLGAICFAAKVRA